MCGGIISSLGLALSSFAQTSSQFSAAFTAYGFGIIFVILPATTCITDYFPDHVSIATGTVLAGGSAGVTAMPWLFQNLLSHYGWRGSILILAGINFHLGVIGALLEPVQKNGRDSPSVKDEMDTTVDVSLDDHASSVQEECATISGGLVPSAENMHEQFAPIMDNSLSDVEVNAVCGTDDDRLELGKWSLARDQRGKDVSHIEDITDKPEEGNRKGRYANCKSKALHLFGLGIFRDHPLMILVFIECFLFCHSYHAWILYVIPNALSKGISPKRAVLVSVTGGAINFIGRLGIGFFWSLKCIRFDLWYSLMFLLSAVAFASNFVAESFGFLMALSACYDLFMGAMIMSQFQLVYNTVGEVDYKTGISVFFFGFGLSGPITGAIFGTLYDTTGSYDVAFGIIAALAVTVALLNITPLCWKRYQRRSHAECETINKKV
ncbi:monocarboxylate transporter 7-like [Lytechinus variegatus]|uniref:monocarboxylate transporter 7-like n=1 Tax=Lytechinus variegatus TaxID=7654 RepID=UPI001BB0E040|nr:monocarboxylate transporter 7-like [Lytechinus variegatus]